MDAARAALERDDVWQWRVPHPRILTALFPGSLLAPGALEVDRRILGPDQDVPWPRGAAWLDYQPLVAAVLADEVGGDSAGQVRDKVFGYTLVSDWRARSATGDPVETADGVPIAIGPCVVTADEVDPQRMFVQVKIDEQELVRGNLNGGSGSLLELIAAASKLGTLHRGQALALSPFPTRDDGDPGRRLWPGALVELSAEVIGTLRNRISTRT